jgi:tetratricopeptide (TPR) repeat protein
MTLQRLQQDRAADALPFFTAALARQSDAGTLINYGLALDRTGSHEAALAAFDRVLMLDPRIFVVHYNRGNARVGASLPKAAGLPELITSSLEDYEALALALVRDPARLASYRQRLTENRDRCALFDTDRYRRGIEAAFVHMWEIAQRGGAPESFAVADLPGQS